MQFNVFLIGSNQPIVVDLNTNGLCEVSEQMSRSRFLAGDIVTQSGEVVRALIPVCRVQLISEVSL